MEEHAESSPSVPTTPSRNVSMDKVISDLSPSPSSSSPSNNHTNSTSESQPDVSELIKTAGSPEAAIQYLLKDKQSTLQQNNQLWRLVDKQRVMIIGLNTDLETALKDKARYRRKLKELMANPAVLRAVGLEESESAEQGTVAGLSSVRNSSTLTPDSPVERENPVGSPVDVALAPYPITPPADRPQQSPTALQDMINPVRTMPKSEDHAVGKFNHVAEEQQAEREQKEKHEIKERQLPYNATLPPSRTLPSEPPKAPPPMPPPDVVAKRASHLAASVTVGQSEKLGKFPAPPRKGPPTPLQLGKEPTEASKEPPKEALKQTPPEVPVSRDVDIHSESDYDDVLEVNDISHGDRGRRRTRQEDSKERELVSLKGQHDLDIAEQRSTETDDTSLSDDPVQQTLHVPLAKERGTGLVPPPMASPGLPASPRPMASFIKSEPVSPPSSTPIDDDLTPRPSKANMRVAPTSPIPASPTASSLDGNQLAQPSRVVQRAVGHHAHKDSTDSRNSPVERTKIFRGLMMDEFPNLLLPPNALESVDIRVASSRMKPSRASLLSLTQLEEDPVFTLAIISRIDEGELWRVEKDSASLMKLDQRMKQCPSFTAKTPDRSLFSGHSPAKLDARRLALNEYLTDLLTCPLDINTTIELCKYLSTNTLPPNADETGAAARKSPDANDSEAGDNGPKRSGYLTKKGKNFGGWKTRFFVLDGPHLRYYETPGGPHLGTIKLQQSQIGRQTVAEHSPTRDGDDAEGQYRHAFLIGEPKKKNSYSLVKHVLCAESDRERDLWVDDLLYWTEHKEVDEIVKPDLSKMGVNDRPIFADDPSYKRKKAVLQKVNPVLAEEEANSQPVSPVVGEPGSAHPAAPEMPPPQSIVISGPKDAHVISDAASWGNKATSIPVSLPVPEEKKQKKRSFFGFGSKAAVRSSSDGQDSVYAGSDSGSVANSQGVLSHVPGVFGIPLIDAVRFHPPMDVHIPLPCVVFRCVQYLEARNAILEEGIFRLSGSNVVIRQIRDRFNNEGDIDLLNDDNFYDIHAIASLLKLYLRELPSTILTRELHMRFLSVSELSNDEEKIQTLADLSSQLPLVNLTLLQYLVAFLIKIINKQDVNKMNVRNVGIVFSPTLNIPAPVFGMFLQNFEAIFGVKSEDYEPPQAGPDGDRNSHLDDPHHVFVPPARPSTSSENASPHRLQQRLEKHQQERMRMTPTPPMGPPRAPWEHQSSQLAPSQSAYAMGTKSAAYEMEYGIPSSMSTYGRPVMDSKNQRGSSSSSGKVPAYDQRF